MPLLPFAARAAFRTAVTMADGSSTPPVGVFITGASSGIGAAAVPLFAGAAMTWSLPRGARRGWKRRRETQRAQPAARLVPVLRRSLGCVRARCVRGSERALRRLDVLVNNAGFGVYGSVAETPVDTYRANLETNFLACPLRAGGAAAAARGRRTSTPLPPLSRRGEEAARRATS